MHAIPPRNQDADAGYGMGLLRCAAARIRCSCTLHARTGQKFRLSHHAEIAQLLARRSRNLSGRKLDPRFLHGMALSRLAWSGARSAMPRTGPRTAGTPHWTPQLGCHGLEVRGGLG